MQNGYIESFNSKFRDECLNEQWFQDLQQARSAIKVWRQDYNEVRPHNSCECVPPAKLEHLHPPPINSPCNPGLPLHEWHGKRGQVSLARPCCGGLLGPRRAQGQGKRGLLRVRPRSRAGDRAAAARSRQSGSMSCAAASMPGRPPGSRSIRRGLRREGGRRR